MYGRTFKENEWIMNNYSETVLYKIKSRYVLTENF
jgi:hypothetical protein